jgi:uncharacterized lipoprotein YddW (UPF0748 family)
VGVERPTAPRPQYLPYISHAPKAEPPKEVRAVWISRFDLGSPPVKRARLEELINKAADAGFTAVLLQVRATGDAYYKPGVEPWSYRLTSSRVSDLGRDPGWDPLAVAVETAHQRGLELHAYLNAFTPWECDRGAPPHTAPEHPYWKLADYNPETQHYDPGWRVHAKVNGTPTPMGDTKTSPVPCAEYIWASPGVERVHEQNLAVIRDIVTRYAVDGIHLDRVRYPGRQYSHDPETYAAWRATTPAVTFEDWQRDHLTAWMGRYGAEIRSIRTGVTFSAAVWFTYKKTAAMTFPTSQGYYDYYQDSHRWLGEGYVDALAPMIYGTTFNADITKWKVLADDHVAAQGGRQVWLGMGADLPEFSLLAERIAYARKIGARGIAVWSAGSLDSRGYWDDFAALWAAAGPP